MDSEKRELARLIGSLAESTGLVLKSSSPEIQAAMDSGKRVVAFKGDDDLSSFVDWHPRDFPPDPDAPIKRWFHEPPTVKTKFTESEIVNHRGGRYSVIDKQTGETRHSEKYVDSARAVEIAVRAEHVGAQPEGADVA